MSKTLTSVRKGITPVVAIVLLLMLTVAIAGGVYAWVNGFFGEQEGELNNQVNTQLNFLDLYCDASSDEIDFFIKNAGSKEVDASDVSFYIRDFSNDRLLEELSTSKTSGGSDLAPGDSWDTVKALTSTDLVAGSEYKITAEFTSNGGTTVSKRCTAD